MTTRIALFLGALILAALALDLWQGWGAALFLTRKLHDLIGWIAFWR